MSSSNYRIAVWSDIEAAVLIRCAENDARLNRCTDPDVIVILKRIRDDDIARLAAARTWIGYHQS